MFAHAYACVSPSLAKVECTQCLHLIDVPCPECPVCQFKPETRPLPHPIKHAFESMRHYYDSSFSTTHQVGHWVWEVAEYHRPFEFREQGKFILDNCSPEDVILIRHIDGVFPHAMEFLRVSALLPENAGFAWSIDDISTAGKPCCQRLVRALAKCVERRLTNETKGHALNPPYGYRVVPEVIRVEGGRRKKTGRYRLAPNHEERELLATLLELRQRGHKWDDVLAIMQDKGYKNRDGRELQRRQLFELIKRAEFIYGKD